MRFLHNLPDEIEHTGQIRMDIFTAELGIRHQRLRGQKGFGSYYVIKKKWWNGGKVIYFKRFQGRRSKAGNTTESKGGIDFQSDKMKLQTQNASGEIKFKVDQAMLQKLQMAPGFVPVVIGVEPLKDLPGFLGVSTASINQH